MDFKELANGVTERIGILESILKQLKGRIATEITLENGQRLSYRRLNVEGWHLLGINHVGAEVLASELALEIKVQILNNTKQIIFAVEDRTREFEKAMAAAIANFDQEAERLGYNEQ